MQNKMNTTAQMPLGSARTLLEGKANLLAVVHQFGGALSGWTPSGEHWEYTNLQIGSTQMRVGVSTGGVVSVNGHPFTPDLKMNVNQDAVRKSILAAIPAVTTCSSCYRVYETMALSANELIGVDVGVCPSVACSGRQADTACADTMATA